MPDLYSDRGIRKMMTRYAEKAGLEEPITPHQFRHVGAANYLRHRPGDFVTVQKLLGHKALKTTLGFYAQLDTSTATKHYNALIAEERDNLDPPPPPRRLR